MRKFCIIAPVQGRNWFDGAHEAEEYAKTLLAKKNESSPRFFVMEAYSVVEPERPPYVARDPKEEDFRG